MNSRKFLSDLEREQLEISLRDRLEIESEMQDALMILVALHSGARASELLALSWPDFNLETGELFIRTIKDGLPREIVLPRFLLTPLKRLKLASPDRPFSFSRTGKPRTEYNRLGEIWRTYRTVEKPFHCLRHTFAMRVYAKTKDIRFTQKALGHKSITNTMVYADYSYSASEFKKMMRIR